MSFLGLNKIAAIVGGKLIGDDRSIDSVFTDTRQPQPEGLFFALKGPNFDAHTVLEKTSADVAAALVVSQPVDHPAAQIIVSDTLKALQDLATFWRQTLTCPVVGLTGSNGKTTVKEMIVSILAETGRVAATRGNLNNEIGVPLTLLSVRRDDDFAVIEMGASNTGDILLLTTIVQPDVALITNAGSAHLQGFGDVETVASAKGEIFDGLGEKGIGIINLDDDYYDYWQWLIRKHHSITFGRRPESGVLISQSSPFVLNMMGREHLIDFPLRGKHNQSNAAAAAAVALALGVDSQLIVSGLQKVKPVNGRLAAIPGPSGSLIIDDTYNANPVSVSTAIDVLADEMGSKLLVLGDMAELGEQAEKLHTEVGLYAAEKQVDRLYTIGDKSKATARGFGEGGLHYEDIDSLCEAVLADINRDTIVLVKGSRSARMERVIDCLLSHKNKTLESSQGGQHYVA